MDRTRRYPVVVASLLAAGVLVRLAYLAAQPGVDPWFDSPVLDGAYYLQWAGDLMAGRDAAAAYYLAPGYPYFLSLLFAVSGVNLQILYLLQHFMVVGTALILGTVARRFSGDTAGIGTVALVLLYHPALYFAGAPLGETLAILLLAVAADFHTRSTDWSWRPLAGLLLGLAVLVRPSFLPVALMWAALELFQRRFRPCFLFLAMVAVAVLPVLVRNLAVSGHPVLVSANAGMTLYHGNGPGAQGIYTPPERFSGRLDLQEAEATRIAAERSGRPDLDPVQADRWWRREAVRTRLQDPAGSVRLVFTRILLSLSADEIGLDYHPGIDGNRFRHAAPLSFAVILGLAGGGIYARRRRGYRDRRLLVMLLGLAAVPVVFYVSSRYRLPLAVFLTVPGGFGIAALAHWKRQQAGTTLITVGLVAGLALLSWIAPGKALSESTAAGALANRGIAWQRAGSLNMAEDDLDRALALDPVSPVVLFNRGVVLQAAGRIMEGRASYEAALALDPGHTEAAGNLSALLMAEGRFDEAVRVLQAALTRRPDSRVCWTNLAVSLDSAGRRGEALEAVDRAAAAGVTVNPELVDYLRSGGQE